VIVRGKRADSHPKVYTHIEVEYILWGDALDRKAVEHAIQLSEEKYCSVISTLKPTVDVKSSYEIID